MDKLSPDTTLALMNVQAHATQTDAAKSAGKSASSKDGIDLAKIEKAADEFEAVFIAEMMKPMFEGIEHDGQFGGGKGEEIFHGMLVEEYGNLLTKSGGIGIADSVKSTMIRMQQEANGMTPQQIAASEHSQNKAQTLSTTELTNGENHATRAE